VEQLSMMDKIKALQAILQAEKQTEENRGVKVTAGGMMEIQEIILNPELSWDENAKLVKQCANQALRRVQMEAAKKMR
jgi:DNA-binding protein YbaB